MYNGLIFDGKGVFYISTAFSSFTENVSINFEHKHFKSLFILLGNKLLKLVVFKYNGKLY